MTKEVFLENLAMAYAALNDDAMTDTGSEAIQAEHELMIETVETLDWPHQTR